MGFQAPEVAELNARVGEGGYLKFNRIHFSRGAGFYTLFPKVRLASMFTFSTFSGTRNEGNASNWLRGTSAGTTLGVSVLNNGKLQLIPYGGVVYSWFGMRVASSVPGNTPFTGYLSGPSNQHHVSANQFMANFGLHLAKTPLGNSAIGQQLILGFRGGYYLPLGATAWKTNDAPLREGPASSAGGLYVQLIVGLLQ
ncbi:MAG: hypothetical protein H7Z75_22685 [Ferruginibacter sp.]|nr:hypothetical protein [Cytophagales bacterium]